MKYFRRKHATGWTEQIGLETVVGNLAETVADPWVSETSIKNTSAARPICNDFALYWQEPDADDKQQAVLGKILADLAALKGRVERLRT